MLSLLPPATSAASELAAAVDAVVVSIEVAAAAAATEEEEDEADERATTASPSSTVIRAPLAADAFAAADASERAVVDAQRLPVRVGTSPLLLLMPALLLLTARPV